MRDDLCVINRTGLSALTEYAPSEFVAFVGIDCADQKCDVCFSFAGSDAREHLSCGTTNVGSS
jgi:hypothetical protein